MTPEERYLDLLKRCLTRTAFLERYRPWVPRPRRRLRRALVRGLRRALQTRGLDLVRSVTIDLERRRAGTDHPPEAETMVGMRRLDHLQACVVDVLERKIPGDLIETGVWRGGASIFMAA
ncbi:MAG: TylF/MycF/NovP-related O-methyltransferase, partial [Myxococcota bacterium]